MARDVAIQKKDDWVDVLCKDMKTLGNRVEEYFNKVEGVKHVKQKSIRHNSNSCGTVS